MYALAYLPSYRYRKGVPDSTSSFELPPDPFGEDSGDPNLILNHLACEGPLSDAERADVRAELEELRLFETLLAPQGIRGITVTCDDCTQEHYHDWDMLRANLVQLLADGTMQPHEPAFDLRPSLYVSWDYCRGYADAALYGTANPFQYRTLK